MFLPRAFVFEKHPRWLPELQRQFQGEEVILQGCDRVPRLNSLIESPCLILLDLEADPQNCLQFLGQQQRKQTSNTVIVIGSPRNSILEWSARELGAVSWLEDSIQGDRLAQLCRRYWEQMNTPTSNTQPTRFTSS